MRLGIVFTPLLLWISGLFVSAFRKNVRTTANTEVDVWQLMAAKDARQPKVSESGLWVISEFMWGKEFLFLRNSCVIGCLGREAS